MKQGYLSQYFIGVAGKILSAVEVDKAKSHQHEINGVVKLKRIFGEENRDFEKVRFIYFDDSDDEPITDEGELSWYDSRKSHPVRSEHRLYYKKTTVFNNARPGDELFIGLRSDNTVLVIIAENGSTISNQLHYLFGDNSSNGLFIRDNFNSEQDRLTFTSRFILEKLGIKIEIDTDVLLDEMIQKFGNQFPSTKEFSNYARSTVPDICSLDDPDLALIEWMKREEILFRTFERHMISERLAAGFTDDIEGFFQFSLSASNTRKSRAGLAFENHVEQLLIDYKIHYDKKKVTENNSEPDFIFPSIEAYQDSKFEIQLLTMLGLKTTCKDRWRQILAEADRIREKHLLTLESGISERQTTEMQSKFLFLVLPISIHDTYTSSQRNWLLSVAEFIETVLFKQRSTSWSNDMSR